MTDTTHSAVGRLAARVREIAAMEVDTSVADDVALDGDEKRRILEIAADTIENQAIEQHHLAPAPEQGIDVGLKTDAPVSKNEAEVGKWRLVPVEPTDAMIESSVRDSVWDDIDEESSNTISARIWSAMIAAAPIRTDKEGAE